MELFPCPCCGYLMFSEPPGSYDICEICFWEDDPVQLRFPNMAGGANHVSLIQAQRNFAAFGACEDSMRGNVRTPFPDEKRDPLWRPLDPELELPIGPDQFGIPVPPKTYFELAAEDFPAGEQLYYWRPASTPRLNEQEAN